MSKKGLLGLSATLSLLFPVVSYAQTVEADLLYQSPSSTTIATTGISQTTTSPTQSTLYPGCVQQLYRVSAYYSPKEGQQVYTRNTYTDEIRLNGRGLNGASGKPVYNGMIAAPASYKFGTKIILPGLGVGEVQDRGGAMVESDGYDRIDVWVGEGDAGLERAKAIGLKWIVGWYCSGEVTTAPVGFDWSIIPDYKDFVSVSFWSIDQGIGRQGALVTRLQGYLKQVGYHNNAISSDVYNEQVKDLVCRFQVDQLGLLTSDPACGVFGPKTRAALKKLLVKQGLVSDASIYALNNAESIGSLFRQDDVRPVWTGSAVVSSTPATVSKVTTPPQVVSGSVSKLDFSVTRGATFARSPQLGEESNEIIILQKILKVEGLFDRSPTGYFGDVTKSALTQMQIRYKLINNSSHPAAGYVGPATRELLLRKQNTLK